ncbi:MAG: hypothetical protein R3B70_12590 [Polyangiaceae bacterium]
MGTATADLDYRLLAPWQTTDPNGNRSQVAFDALGRVTKAAVMGKAGGTDGDTLADPTVLYTYELDRWKVTGDPKPAYIKTEHREEHGAANTRWQTSYAFLDGAGAAAMVKVNAEPAASNGPARWVATGRTVVWRTNAIHEGSRTRKSRTAMKATIEERLKDLEYMWTTRKDDHVLVPVGINPDGSPRYFIQDISVNHGVVIEDNILASEVKRRMLAAGVHVGNPNEVEFRKSLIRKRLGRGSP